MQFYNGIGQVDSKYSLDKDYCLILFFIIDTSSFDIKRAKDIFKKSYKQDKKLTLKILMYARDEDNGVGQRAVFKELFIVLCEIDPLVARQLLPHMIKVGRCDDILAGLFTPVEEDVAALVYTILKKDTEAAKTGEPISLLPRWLPLIDPNNKTSTITAKRIVKLLNMTNKEYEQLIIKLRKVNENDFNKTLIKAVGEYLEFLYIDDEEKVSSCLKPTKSSLRKDIKKERLYDVVFEIKKQLNENQELDDKEKEILNKKWELLKEKENYKNTIFVRDGSPSISCNNLPFSNIIDSLTIYFSQLFNGVFQNKFITYQTNSQIITLKSSNICDKVKELSQFYEVSTPELSKIYNLISSFYKFGFSEGDSIKKIIIISDTDYDNAFIDVYNGSYSDIQCLNEFKKIGLEIPQLIYWNINSNKIFLHHDKSKSNVIYINGFSNYIYDCLVSGKDIYSNDVVEYMVSIYNFVDEIELT